MSDYIPILTLTDDNFSSQVLASNLPVLVDFWAPWCGPCRMVTPIITEVATEFEGRAKVAKLNTDQYDRIANQYGIQAIPTLLFFKDGKVVDQVIGVAAKATLAAKLTTLVQPTISEQAA